ncbi:hypothetical protein [Glutamicibacter sp. PS]|uniref:hypothetical protein n=1 Tax=Glutamicibacter sp. PS TaxID=3075634 RepID=UPI0028478413|nr:hypothetical protein [Glutamicibacter sp. PS]MDR4532132.1 hypothetical protein [Glutamicibacter sp. PS]
MSSTSISQFKRRGWISGLMLLPTLLIVITRGLLGASLPPVTATHWSTTRYPDGFTDSAVFFAVCLTLGVVGVVVAALVLIFRHLPKPLILALLFIGGLTAWVGAGLFIGCSVPTALAGDPTRAVLGAGGLVGIAAAVMGLLPAALSGLYGPLVGQNEARRAERIAAGRRAAENQVPVSSESPAAGTVQMERIVNAPAWLWVLGVTLIGLVAFTVIMALTTPQTDLWLLIWMLFLEVVCLVLVGGLLRVQIRITRSGLLVRSALFGFPLRRIENRNVLAATSELIEPMQWGGWGWRFFPGGSAVVMRRTQGLVVETLNGKRFAVTMPDSEQAARLLHGAEG